MSQYINKTVKKEEGYQSAKKGKENCYNEWHWFQCAHVVISGLYFPCSKDYECYLDAESLDVLECKQEQCVCKEGEQCYSKG